MDSIKIINSDQIGLSPYNKMDEENVSQNQLNHGASRAQAASSRTCQWPHQWTLTECCCGCSVRTGSLIIGWCFLFLSSFLLFGTFVGPLPYMITASFLRWEDVLFTCVKVLSSLLLLIGIYKNKERLVRVSVILSGIDIVIEVIVSTIMSVIIGDMIPITVVIFILPISFYFLVVVNSLANQMAMGFISLPQLGMNV